MPYRRPRTHPSRRAVAVLLALLIVGLAPAAPARAQAALFEPVARVLQHPRCTNCHVAGDFVRQGEQGRRHIPNVQRGPDNKGVGFQRCGTCHGAANNPTTGVPGAPNWQFAPPSTSVDGLSAGDSCRALKDPARNGNRSVAAVIEHMRNDPLVRWAWTPGRARSVPLLGHAELVAALEAWANAGAPCPP